MIIDSEVRADQGEWSPSNFGLTDSLVGIYARPYILMAWHHFSRLYPHVSFLNLQTPSPVTPTSSDALSHGLLLLHTPLLERSNRRVVRMSSDRQEAIVVGESLLWSAICNAGHLERPLCKRLALILPEECSLCGASGPWPYVFV